MQNYYMQTVDTIGAIGHNVPTFKQYSIGVNMRIHFVAVQKFTGEVANISHNPPQNTNDNNYVFVIVRANNGREAREAVKNGYGKPILN